MTLMTWNIVYSGFPNTDHFNQTIMKHLVTDFFGYKTEFFFSFQNNPKNLDLSYKMDLDLWDCLGKIKFVL